MNGFQKNEFMKHSCLFVNIHVAPQAKALFQVLYVIEVLVAVIQVFTSHAPDEGVVVGGGSGVDAPFG